MSTLPESREWSEDELQLVLKYFGRHLLALVLAYRCRGDDGELSDETHFACLTAFVITVGQQWYLVTAGHNIEDWRPAMRANGPTQIVGVALADYFGVDAKRMVPLKYHPFDQAIYHAYRQADDIDYAVTLIHTQLRKELESNGVMPLPVNESRNSFDDFYGYGVVGFPEEYCKPSLQNDIDYRAAEIKPVLVPLKRIELPTPRGRQPAFIADVIDMGDQKNVLGMSGGPILGYLMGKDGKSQYEVVAIQSQWSEKGRVIACPVTVALDEIRRAIEEEDSYTD
jgi:hypothetical protein